jgi:hypothetical protein
MARIKYSALIGSLSGSIGGSTFQTGLYGNVLRSRPRNTRQRTADQMLRNSSIVNLQNQWKALTPAQRKQWEQFIAYSSQSINRDRNVLITGQALFLKYNYHRLMYNLAALSVPEYRNAPQWAQITNFSTNGTYLRANFNLNTITLNERVTIYVSFPHAPNLVFNKTRCRLIVPNQNSGTYYQLQNYYLSKYGKLPDVGQTISFACQFWSLYAPILSAIQTGTAIVTA